MYDMILSSLAAVVAWPAIGYLVLGTILGLFFGAVPGLSGLVGMAILLPFTFTMEPVAAFAFLLGMYAVTTTSDTLASVLLGIPGTSASQATILDGYPMAKKGEAARALGAAFFVSAVGGLLGALFLGLSIPVLQPVILAFAQPEFFMLGVLALTMVASLSGGSILLGLVSALLGLLISYVGYSPTDAIPRYTFDVIYLFEGLPLIPVILGLFALPELLALAVGNTSISRVDQTETRSRMLDGVYDAIRNWWLVLRSSAIGCYVGLLPGLGGSIVDWIAYGHVVQSSRDKSRFGEGDIRGVIAPEAANNAQKGAALIPTVTFGIPGSAPMAILLGALLIQGLQPGPQMLTTKLDITLSMMWTMVIANVLGAGLLFLFGRYLVRLTFVPGHLIVPGVCLFLFMGAWLATSNMGDWVALLLFGMLGYLMKCGGIPRAPLVLGIILGPIMENALAISLSAYNGYGWIGRPIVVVLAVMVVVSLGYAIWNHAWRGSATSPVDGLDAHMPRPGVVAARPVDQLLPLVILTGAFVAAAVLAVDWPANSARFPLMTGIPGAVLAVVALGVAFRHLQADRAAGRGLGAPPQPLGRVLHFAFWLLAIVGVTILLGQRIALPLFAGLYLVVWGGYGWRVAVPYALGCLSVLMLIFDQVVAVSWYPALVLR
ncbi:tripartite tricarboxylate transporter permease [Stappia stellulata]|uniref:tripartite tricarboxylate transporter permease n=1 Tax=Stappia stellulata TaxID=71235 RepID=UPI001CD36164|nr:tripartite tricarboxylate transporter permease [Stappia stellulata]MCA1241512.1 tripartite tricarboxylate transporter permease [Stappia stellulata]